MPKKTQTKKDNPLHEHHKGLVKKNEWYADWHDHPAHPATHWMILITIALVIGGLFYLRAQMPQDSTLESMQGFASALTKEGRESQISDSTRALLNAANDIRSASPEEKSVLVADLVELAKQRKELIKQSLKDNPGALKRNAIPKGLRQQLPSEVQTHVEEEKRISGSFLWIIEEGDNMEPTEKFYIKDRTSKLTQLHVAHWDKTPPMTDQQVNVTALVIDDNAVVNASDITTTSSVVPSVRKKVAVIMVNFNSNPTQISTREYVQSLVYTGPSSVRKYYEEASFGNWTIEGKNNIDGDIYGWYTLNYTPPTSHTTDALLRISELGKRAAAADGFDQAGYTNVIFYMPNMWSINGVAFVGGTDSYIDGDTRVHTTIHELGHNYGLGHAALYHCRDANNVQTVISGTCSVTGYGDPYAVMSNNSSGHMNAIHKGTNGVNWITSANKVSLNPSVSTGGTYNLLPIEYAGTGTQSIQILKDPNTSKYYYLEFRQPFGWDANWTGSNVYTGVSIRVGGDYSQYNDTALVDTHPSATYSAMDAALQVGETFTDSAAGINIFVSSVSAAGAVVDISFTGSQCSATSPAVTLSPASQTGNPGSTLAYNFTLRNNDSTACGNSTFNLSSILPSGWFSTPSISTYTLAPGSTLSGVVNVTSPTTATGNNTISLRAVNSYNSSYTSTATSTFVIGSVGTGDTTPPTVTIKSPVNGAIVKKGSIKFNSSASDASGMSSIVLKSGSTIIKTCTNTTTCSANVSVGSLPVGANTLSVTATDKAPTPNTTTQTVTVNRQ